MYILEAPSFVNRDCRDDPTSLSLTPRHSAISEVAFPRASSCKALVTRDPQ
jgi:hypothetical protein